MKKLVIAIVAVAALALAFSVHAEEKYVGGGFEASGHIMTGFGFQYVGANSGAYAGSEAGLARDGWAGFNKGQFLGNTKSKDFGFLVDNVELNLMKTFGENIKTRVDLLVGDQNLGAWDHVNNGINLWQAYVTANIPVGNGLELLAGRFDAPMGYESAHRYQNNTITRSSIFNFGIRPWTLTGLKLYYAFSDAIDWHIYAVNNLEDQMGGNWRVDNSALPSFGTRVGYTWGEEGKQSTVGLSAAFGPEQKCKSCVAEAVGQSPTSKIGRMSFLGDLDFNIWATDAFAIGGEGIFRQDDKASAPIDGLKAQKYFGGILDLHYVFSDVWDGTLKYSILYQTNGSNTSLGGLDSNTFLATIYAPQQGGKAYFNEISLAGGYQITDGAKFNAEYRLDWSKYNGAPKNLSHSVLGMFAYSF